MSVCIETLKRMNLVDFLAAHYGLEFKRIGSGYAAGSPFGEDRNPSFFVRNHEGRWLFKDFSSGFGGSIIDFVRIKENLSEFPAILRRITELIGAVASQPMAVESTGGAEQSSPKQEAGYDINRLYARFQREDGAVCRQYLVGRGIDVELVDKLLTARIVVHNRYHGGSYCCFAVHDASGDLQCLDNHRIDGKGKFLLGRKRIFSLDWEKLGHMSEVFICESIIDYLSMKTLEGPTMHGLALLGNQLLFEAELLSSAGRIIAAVDDDRGGYSAILDLYERYPDKEVKVYDLQGYKDPNEFLQARKKAGNKRFSAEQKLELYRQFQRAENKAELARQWGIDRSYMYEVVRGCEELLLTGLAERRPGRRRAGQPDTMQEAQDRIERLEKEKKQLNIERDKLYCRGELMQVRLKWAEIEAAELRGEPVDAANGTVKKYHIKKKKKKRRFR